MNKKKMTEIHGSKNFDPTKYEYVDSYYQGPLTMGMLVTQNVIS